MVNKYIFLTKHFPTLEIFPVSWVRIYRHLNAYKYINNQSRNKYMKAILCSLREMNPRQAVQQLIGLAE